MKISKTLLAIGTFSYLAGKYFQHHHYVPVQWIQFDDTFPLPTKGTNGAAGFDITVQEDVHLAPGETYIFTLGYGVKVPKGYYVSLQTRSGLSIKSGIVLANGTEGVIDSDYRDPIKIAIYNRSSNSFHITPGMRVAQLLFKRYEEPFVLPSPVYDLLFDSSDNNRTGGLGSTGIHINK